VRGLVLGRSGEGGRYPHIPRPGKPRKSPLLPSRGPIDKAARKRRRQGGKLALGRPSGTLADLDRERTCVFERAAGKCELCRFLPDYDGHPPTDFAHVRARSAGGSDDRWNALATCNRANLAMQGAYSKGRPLVTPITVNGVRGFDVEWVQAKDKFAYREGDFTILGAGFVRAEKA